MTCSICGLTSTEAFTKKILYKYDVKFYKCNGCGFIQTQKPFWLEEAYKTAMNLSDTGYVLRNVYLSRVTVIIFYFLYNTKKPFLDFAGGYGIFTRLMRDYGLDFYWYDLYEKNIFAKGFEKTAEEAEAITCFECFEHFSEPLDEIKKLTLISKNIFFSTRVIPEKELPEITWEYYGFEHGQHVSFYSIKTLKYIANTLGLNFYTDGKNLHLFTEKKVTKLFFSFLLLLSKFQADIFIRKLLKSKTTEDSILLSKSKL